MVEPLRSHDATNWLGLEPGEERGRFRMPLARRLCAPHGALFGGALLGAIMAAAHEHCGRAGFHAHAQFRSVASGPEALELVIDESREGRQLSHMTVLASQGDRVRATALVALATPFPHGLQARFVDPPEVPPPESCPEREYADPDPSTINGTLDVRVARSVDDGCVLWARSRGEFPVCAATLAVLADHVPYAARRVLGSNVPVVSLDHSLRVFRAEPTEWVLLDVGISAIEDALGHGRVRLWSLEGSLLAEGSQSFRVL